MAAIQEPGCELDVIARGDDGRTRHRSRPDALELTSWRWHLVGTLDHLPDERVWLADIAEASTAH